MLWLFGIFAILTPTTFANLELENFEGPVDLDDSGRYVKFGKMDHPPSLSNSINEDNADEQDNSAANGDAGSKSNIELNDCNLASRKNLVLYFPGKTREILVKCLTPEETNLKDRLSEAANKRRKRSVQFSEDENRINNKNKRNSSPMATWFHFHTQDKMIPIQERQDPLQEKKSPAFNPWGGKRMMVLRENFNGQRAMRMPFNSWGGKRSDESFEKYNEEKRGRFFNWGGKRVPFDSWGGKRAKATERQRVPFNSWGGKRVSFHNWGGKRGWILEEDGKETGKDRRHIFNSYYKRSKTDSSDELDVKRTKFHAWGGKRSDDFYSGLSKRIPEEVIDKRSPLDSWSVYLE
ncbi:uncharacterized protein LOC107266344 [Cephus cinctus]|uniref:Uncharacterized protein LOC107266344 n=1 Tax=Cephus cinctus TaxID=211228 RepID=A0AAJ7RET7_CEPCN|nr:uncharacterized protein LOC107266344 [Cephus cinctus]